MILDGYSLPSDVGLHQVIVLPKAEWERIQDSLGSTAREAARVLAERRARTEMHLRSKAAVKDWPNTIMGLAQRKLKAKNLSKERKEEEKRLIDLEEAQFQAAKRKEAIDQARTYQYYRNERVKGFHSALLLTEVLKERDAQVEFKKLKQDINKKKEEEMEHARNKAVLREEEKARSCEHYMKQKALRRDQLEQIKEHEHQAELAKLADKREGEEIQRLTRLYQLEIQKEKEKEQAEKLERRRLHHEHVADQKIIKAAQEQKQQEEDDRIRAHFKAKQIIAKMRREKEDEMHRLMQEHQDTIVNRLAAQMNEAFKMEDDRIARDIGKKEAKQEQECKDKEEKKKADIESIAEHRATVMRMKAERKKEEKAEGKKELYELMEADRIYLEMEGAKKQRRRYENMEVQKIHIQQMAEKQARRQQEKQADLDYDAQREIIALFKEQEFQNYAKQVIELESKTTHNLYPLLKASKEGTGFVYGPLSRGNGSSYQAQDTDGTQLPCICTATQEVET
ncbi:coiled-coil domain-containing protein 173-like [Nothoprocta perdicaria]|uniref:coiled-coil domain-containing protein 173-like n=1 Tax=Nothoprocta perdicaria TaxID=30464 RepID=UPI000E1BD7C3|nr:coiled-coil domain-containing protein 173-like [Nothoprocta perdicaria]